MTFSISDAPTLRGGVSVFEKFCKSCGLCVAACPVAALSMGEDRVEADASRCIGCQTCVLACPFGAMDVIQAPVAEQNLGSSSVRSTISVAHKCDLCIDVATGPACIPSCPTEALYMIDPAGLEATNNRRREKTLTSMPQTR